MKIVATGGGNDSNLSTDGTPKVFEQKNIFDEIIRLTGKYNPNVLIVPHAHDTEYETKILFKMLNVFDKIYHCDVKIITESALSGDGVDGFLDYADIIYVLGGDSKRLMDTWRRTGFDKKLIELADTNKVLCGNSAGGGCWFKYICSDYLQKETGNPHEPFKEVEGLGLIDLIFNPHADEHGRLRDVEKLTEKLNINGLSLTDNMAIEIVDGKYKLIEGDSNNSKVAIFTYWKDGIYSIEPVNSEGDISELTLIKTNSNHKIKK